MNTLRKKTNGTNKEWEAGGKRAPRRCRDNVTRGSSPPPKAKEESSSLDNLSPRYDRDPDPFDDPPKAKYKSVGVITSGGGADYRPGKTRKKLRPSSPKAGSDSESDSDSSESDDGKDNDPPPKREDPPPDDDKPPRRTISAPWRPIRSPSKRSAQNKDNGGRKEHRHEDKTGQDDVTMEPLPRYKHGEIVYYWSAESKEYWVGVIRGLKYPTCKDEKITTYRYEIEPEGVSLTTNVPSVLILQRDVRPLEWAITHLCPSLRPTEMGECAWRVKNDEKGVPALRPPRHQQKIEVDPVVQNKPLARTKRRRWRKTKVKSTVLVISESLHDLNMVGIDTCSAVSVSTERGDFPLYLDETTEAKDSVVLNGVGGANASIGGRGPLVVRAKDSEGNDLVVFD